MTEDQAAELAQSIIRQCNDAGRPGIGIAFGTYAGHHRDVVTAMEDMRDRAEAFDLLQANEQKKLKGALFVKRADAATERRAAEEKAKKASEEATALREAEEKSKKTLSQTVSSMTVGQLLAALETARAQEAKEK